MKTFKTLAAAFGFLAGAASAPAHATLCPYCSWNGPSLDGHVQTDAKARVIVAIVLPE